ncbi:DNA helicase-2/ATP-dependent DNA helicase PcrA [Mobilisporobacter senegalensis]|uniref:DNA helicase-2/ATP-dependent DNA helicase PcrA n=1 Tax=Mobilisporobacter senegalensis TaxID=1329262 RepID=A0A3N1XI50_9FIRM|nr:ATP-binding domain-containing protein [Mobilisporobacter senegalensis]ROR25811.1 DNA helicase-2/ATP-dependent DNA helicase PcrA [Mobilisporobacter senegalensis]
MGNNQSELEYEIKRLEETISLAKKQLNQARQRNEENKSAILSAKKELRENTTHSISGLWSSDGFEALAELSQYVNPVTEKIADYEAVENKILLLENLIKSPYFARIDFKFDDEDMSEKIYIGRSSLKKDNSYEMYIYDWRSPIASVFYRFVTGQAFYDSPGGRITGEVDLKRQYEINNGVLEYYFDADVQIVDEILRKLLSQNTSSKMKTIVESIQKEQDIVIRDMENDLLIVQGVAGSGKTSIALHRAAYLMYQGLSSKLSANNIIIISPNTLFEQYISNVIPELGEDNVVSVIFEEMLASILQNERIQSRNQFLENLITSSGYRDIIKSSIEFKTSHQFMEILNLFIRDIPDRWIEFEDIYYEGQCIVTKEVLKEKILGRNETPLGVKLKQLEDFIVESIYESKKIRLKKSVKKEILKFTEINVLTLYRKLFNDREYFYDLVKDFKLPDCIEDILIYTQENLNTKLLYYDDATALAYLNLKINGANEYKNIKQVVIDEAQDYYPLHYEIFNLLFANSQFTILGDINQTLEKKEDLSLYEQISKILNRKKSSLVTMDKSFRCTNEILMYSSKFIKQSLEIKSFNRKGDEPKIYTASDQLSLNDMIISEIKLCLEKGYQSIGLICKTEKNAISLFGFLKDRVDVQLIKDESTADLHGVFIIPVYMSKGLEFDAVLICDTDTTNYHSEDDKNLLYIGCTRALHRLNLFCKGEASPLL